MIEGNQINVISAENLDGDFLNILNLMIKM